MSDSVTYVVRTEGMVNSYGLGKEVSPGVALFEAGKYNLTYEELQKEIKKIPKGSIKRKLLKFRLHGEDVKLWL